MNGAVLVGALLLVWSGVAKAARPDDTARALRSARLPGSPALVRALAVVEVVIGAGAVVVGGRAFDAAMAASFCAFAAFVGLALERGWTLSSCGCFGEADAPPTGAHVAITGALAVLAAAAAAGAHGAHPLAAMRHHPGTATALGLMSAVTAGLVVVTLTRLPRLRAERSA